MGVTMSTLLEEIENYDACAAAKLKEADFQTDSEIRTLTAADLHELFPGQEKLVLRKTIFDMIHKQQGACQQQGNPGLIQQDALRNVVIAECFDRIKTMKDRLEERQAVLEVRKKKMKDIRRVKYKTVVSGQTYGADDQILEQIQTSGLNLMEGKDEERCITIVFCPVGSQIGTDAEAAMRTVPGDDPVILVMMHHSQQPKKTAPTRVPAHFPNIVLEVHIFYHKTQNGLLRCEQNEKAVIELKEQLQKHQNAVTM